MYAVEISCGTSVLVWQVAFGKQKKDGNKERINEGMNKRRNKEKGIEKSWGSFCLKAPIPTLHLWEADFPSGGHNPAISMTEKAVGKQEQFFF